MAVRVRRGVLVVPVLLLGWSSAAAAQATPSPPVTVHLALATDHVTSGHRITGTVVLTNTSDRTITVDTCAVNGWLSVGLSGHGIAPSSAHTVVGCNPTVRLAHGAHRFRVTVITTYGGCAQAEPAGNPSQSILPCVMSSGSRISPPPLPAGKYSAVVQLVGLDGDTRAQNRVVVTLAASKKPLVYPPCTDLPGHPIPTVTVPNVVGLSSSAAALSFAHACLNAGYASPVGTHVTAEAPVAGSTVAEHSTVILSTQGTAATAP